MNSVTIVKSFDGEDRQASILERYLPLYAKEGWKVVDESVKANQTEPCELDGFETKDQVEKYILDKYEINIDKRGSLETVKEKAKAVINESKRVD